LDTTLDQTKWIQSINATAQKQVKVLGVHVVLVTAVVSCEKSDDKKCSACDIEGVEICEVDGDKVGIFENGERLGELFKLPSDISFEDAASQLCAEIERQVNEAGGCY